MKKKIIVTLTIIVIIVIGMTVWLYGYYNHKNMDNIPSKEIMITYLQEKGEQYATEQLVGFSRDSLCEIWGEPDILLSGLWGDAWEIDDSTGIIVFYDTNNKVESVKLGRETNIEDFYVGLTWGVAGQSSYDSRTGKLVKTTNATNPEEYVATLQLSDTELEDLYNMIMEMDIESYPELYDPYNAPDAEIKIGGSKPTYELILNVQTDTFEKTIECSCVLAFGENKGYNDEAQDFLDVCERIYEIIISSEEWKALPEYEVLYE